MNVTRTSHQFLLGLPYANEFINCVDFHTVCQDYFGLPNTLVDAHVGVNVKGTPLDAYGRVLTTANMSGDGLRHRHDNNKWNIFNLVCACQVNIEAEVLGLFASCIPQASAFHGLTLRKRQTLVPDLKITPLPPKDDHLLELKCFGYARYLHTRTGIRERGGAVNRRAARIDSEYRRKARNADRKYNGTPPGVCGPVQTRLKSYGHIWGLAIGPRGEISKDLERLIDVSAKIGAERKWRAMGSRSQREAAAVLKNAMRRRIGVVAVRENARLKRERLAIILSPDGGAAAAGRRAAAYGHFNARDEQDMFHFTGRRG